MKKLILIGGDLAGGKSTFANILRDKFNILVINKDRLKEIVGDTIIVDNREDNKKLSVVSFNIMKYLIEKNDSVLVLESNFKSYEMAEIKNLIIELGYDVLSIVFKGDNQILQERFLNRLNENRHYVHKSQDFTNIDDFIKVLDDLRAVEYPGEVINIDCSDFSYQANEDIYNRIKKFIEKR